MAEKKVQGKVAARVSVDLPVGTKVYDEEGNEIGEVTSWKPSGEAGFVDAQAVITDPEMMAVITGGGRQTFSIGAKIVLDPAEKKE